jgi:hypothetical protein
VVAAAIGVQATDARSGHEDHHHHHHGKAILRFDSMAPVTGAFVGTAHPVRGLDGGGLPWQLRRAHGVLRRDGRIDVRVKGLVLARQAPVPANLQGTNPIPQFRAIVSCLTQGAPDQGTTVQTAAMPASPRGNAHIRARLSLPHPCVAPVIFVTAPTGAWFAATGA